MEEQKKVLLAGIIFVVIVVIGAAIYYFFIYQKPGPAKDMTQMAQEPIPTKEKIKPEEEEVEPLQVDLDESDALVRDLVEELSSHPKLALWLMTDDIIRKFVAAVDNIANGHNPKPQIDFFKPEGSFLVKEEDGETFIDPESYRRYDSVAEVFLSLDTKGCATLYKKLRPTMQDAYKELGYPEGDFQTTLRKAIRELLNVPIVNKNIHVVKDVVTYKMTDPELESLSQAQKQLLRMGPENVRRIQAKLKDIAQALGFQE
jgi:flagellar basal body-associated protein FliL